MIYIDNKKMFLRKIKKENNRYYISKINKKIEKKLIKKLKKYKTKKIACNKEIMKNKEFINYMYANNIDIYNGKILYKYIIKNIFEYLEYLGFKLEKINVAILVNENSKINMQIIYLASNIFKSISIITNNQNKFRKIENELEENGISINIANNKKKSLSKTDLIINIDFPKEIINKFNINNKAIILNIEENIKIQKKKFEGININYYEIDFKNEFLEYENFDKNIIYEGLFLEKLGNLPIENLKIKSLIGNRGTILKEEFEKIIK